MKQLGIHSLHRGTQSTLSTEHAEHFTACSGPSGARAPAAGSCDSNVERNPVVTATTPFKLPHRSMGDGTPYRGRFAFRLKTQALLAQLG